MTDTDKRAAYIEGLHQIADFLAEHPEVPLPHLGAYAEDSRASGRKVSAVLKELVRAQWIRAARADERQRGESQYLIYYRLDEFGPAALNGEAR